MTYSNKLDNSQLTVDKPLSIANCQLRFAHFFLPIAYCLLFSIPQISFAQRAVPEHGGVWVHDEANVLSASTKAQLEAVLKAERDSTSNQIAVLIIPSLEGDDIDSYGIRVAEAWKVGTKEKDNGAILIVAIQD